MTRAKTADLLTVASLAMIPAAFTVAVAHGPHAGAAAMAVAAVLGFTAWGVRP